MVWVGAAPFPLGRRASRPIAVYESNRLAQGNAIDSVADDGVSPAGKRVGVGVGLARGQPGAAYQYRWKSGA